MCYTKSSQMPQCKYELERTLAISSKDGARHATQASKSAPWHSPTLALMLIEKKTYTGLKPITRILDKVW